MTAPEIAVVVPTRNRAHLLPRLLDALDAQLGAPPFEVVVVDDASTDATAAVVNNRILRPSSRALRLVHGRGAGAGAARNLGWRSTAAPLVAFTDDDCTPDPAWLAALARAAAGADVVQGRTDWDPADHEGRGPFSRIMQIRHPTWQFETCNVAYRRELLERLGGFDERFPGDAYGEDVDLGWRALETGARATFAGDALVIHDIKHASPWKEVAGSLRDAWRWRYVGRLVREHPGYRPHRVRKGVFVLPHHAHVAAALAGAGLVASGGSRRRIVGLAAMVPWLWFRTVRSPRPSRPINRPSVLAIGFVVDSAEVLVVAASGLRYRRPIL